jgi:hypothetical protein
LRINLMTKMTATKRLEAIGLNDPTVAALLKELKENAMTKSDAEPDVTRAARLLGEYAQANGYDRFTWKMAVKTPGEEQEPYRVEAVSEAALAQSDAEPVAWRIKTKNGSWLVSNQKEAENWGDRAEPLYAAPPRPDASAGLIEAAEWRSMETAPRQDGARILIKNDDRIGVYRYSSGNEIYDFRTWQPEGNERRAHIFANDHGEEWCKWLPLDLPAELRARAADRSGK